VAELTPATEEVANLWIREGDTRRHTNEAEEKFMALAERARLDAMETERIWKEQDELLQTLVGLHAEHDLACQERADAHQWIDHLLGELEKERELKIKVEDMATSLAIEVS
jgi:hypothetical protein